ncbi:shock protein C [Bacteroides phage PhiCrAssBcn1]|uniref:Shock protein C n=1 Tax=Bacteroides phage crAss001 TaxID=2301731 RepID=A0A385DTI1_BPCA1|nr:shock protein C [Bacteroides phage crAss001]WCF57004.1 shock protein C [Bacteroides phage PhiCrAssBcn9]WCF57080.1 shock protein C [Bacteroides phage PhiCrAssBcn13]WCF57200.1 shock protein C [Bacteroides phage PhiCrAssBcn22]WCF57330.1 shock protein C [Bacteroides phage PhiCrAssBcn24]WCF57371.1 shock protein C [Bacteroides phage PhiCrAssBcn1]WCF57536.1 shock protein C [Bacteroides phage PhiCrAssBcn2]WCF57580.1 shock protein C [Bacteroides phage PhiCrAssBcn3]WCF58123.1 shock protein C [Bact
MSDFKTRLVEEQVQLEEKLNKLSSFILSDNFNKIDDVQKALLQVQATAMNTYNQCLKERLERL